MDKLNFNILQEKMTQVKDSQLSKKDFYSWLDENIKITNYLSIIDKYSIIKLFVINFEYEYLNDLLSGESEIGADYFYMKYDIESLFSLLFGYTNVEIKKEDKTYDNYDLIFISGFYEYINSVCNNDYTYLKEKCDRVIGINDLTIISKLNEVVDKNIDINGFNEFMTKFEDIMKDENITKNLKFINNIEMFNDKTLANIISNIKNEPVNEIKGVNQ